MKRSNDIDREVALRVRARRIQLGHTQHQLGEAIGVTYQMVHKLEAGLNRFSAGRLALAARFLRTTTSELVGETDESAPEVVARSRKVLAHVAAFSRLPQHLQDAVADVTRKLV